MSTRLRPGDRTVPESERSANVGLAAATMRQVRRARRLRRNVRAWAVGVTLVTALWVRDQWASHGAFARVGNSGHGGDWNPTLWAVIVGLWSLVVGIMALQARLERPPTAGELEREAARTPAAPRDARRLALARIEAARRVEFHVAAWLFGMVVLTPIWALIEWQDNGRFERLGGSSTPGEWEPWILYVGGIWALVVAALALTTRRRGGG